MILNYSATAAEIEASLVGKVIRYYAEDSATKQDGVRTFKIQEVKKVDFAKNGKRYLVATVLDADDNDNEKRRTLHLAGINSFV